MNFIKRIFTNQSGKQLNSEQEDLLLKDLFIEEEEPDTADESIEESAVDPIELFLNKNYESIGYRDGFEHPDNEFFKLRSRALISEFQTLLSKQINHLESNKCDINIRRQQTDEIAMALNIHMKETLLFMDLKIQKLEKEKELAAMQEGMVMKVINQYKAGYVQGVKDNTDAFLNARSAGIFQTNKN